MRHIALLILLVAHAYSEVAAETVVDPAFEAKVEAAMRSIQLRRLASARQEYEAMTKRLGDKGIAVKMVEDNSNPIVRLAVLGPIEMKSLSINNRNVLAVRFASDAEAESNVASFGHDAIVVGSWAYFGRDQDPEMELLSISMDGRMWSGFGKRFKDPITPERLAELNRSSDEGKVALQLRTALFTAEVQVQSGGYQDANTNMVGEYCVLSQLSGGSASTNSPVGQLHLLPAGWNGDKPIVNNFHVVVYLPGKDETDAVSTAAEVSALGKAGADLREKNFVAYAWPTEGTKGNRFAICQDGMIRVRMWDGKPPAWNSLWEGGKPWSKEINGGWRPWHAP